MNTCFARLRTWSIWLAAGGALLFAALHYGPLVAGRTAPDGAGYILTRIGRGTLEKTISCTGTLAAVGTVDVGTQVSGTIREINTDFNRKVHKGEVLARLDPALFEAAVTEARAELMRRKAELALARSEEGRNQPLYAKGFLTEQEYLPLASAVTTAEAALLSAEAAVKRARINLDHATITSPIDGTVIKRNIEAGQTIAASLNAPTLFVIAEDLSRMQIETNVDESDIGQVREGLAVRFTVQAYPDKTFTGEVTQIRLQPQTIASVVNYTVVVDAANADGLLLPGMTATALFIVGRAENALLVANSALRFTPEPVAAGDPTASAASPVLPAGRADFFIPGENGRPERIEVETGLASDLQTVVVGNGLVREGMSVISGKNGGNGKKEPKKTAVSFLPPPPGKE